MFILVNSSREVYRLLSIVSFFCKSVRGLVLKPVQYIMVAVIAIGSEFANQYFLLFSKSQLFDTIIMSGWNSVLV